MCRLLLVVVVDLPLCLSLMIRCIVAIVVVRSCSLFLVWGVCLCFGYCWSLVVVRCFSLDCLLQLMLFNDVVLAFVVLLFCCDRV